MPAQEVQQRKQGQSENGEKIAVDLAEQLRAEAFELIGADRAAGVFTDLGEIALDERIAERPH